ncbi:MAG: protoheme IX farnesyltransferase [SAR324 cluster bacterium]|nr:protoheme IX farnesyltransferase [SAR324 cluster bacterium]
MSKYLITANVKVVGETEEGSLWNVVKLCCSMTKPRIVISISLSALIGFVLHPNFLSFPFWMSSVLVLSVALTTAGGAVLNHYLERESDKFMERTKNRPLPSGKLRDPQQSFWFGISLAGIGIFLSYQFLGTASAVYLFLGAFSYVVIYTAWLKHRSIWNVPVGGICGTFAVFVGSSVGGGALTLESCLFGMMLHFWSPAHFWNFAVYQRNDYRKAGIPQLPEVVGIVPTNCWIAAHTIAVIFCSAGLAFWGSPGWLFGGIALISGFLFLFFNLLNIVDPSDALSRKNFIFSLIYLTALFLGIVVDFYFQFFLGLN